MDNTSSNLAIDRMLQMVEVMSEFGKPLRLNEIAERCSIPASTAMRILNALIANGYAQQNEETLLYSLTMKFLMIGTNIRENLSANQLIHPYLQSITKRLNLSCALAVLDNDHAVYIDECICASAMIRIYHHLAHGYELYTNASGKLFLSQFTREEFLSYCRKRRFIAQTPKSILTVQDLEKSIAKIHEQGYSINDEENMLGMRCFSVPIYNVSGSIAAAISVSGTVYQIPLDQIPTMVNAVNTILDQFYEEYTPLLTVDNIFNL